MPCSDSRDRDDQNTAVQLLRDYQITVRLLCEACRELERTNGTFRHELSIWWKEHQGQRGHVPERPKPWT